MPCTCLVLSRVVVEDLLKTKPRVARFLTEIVGRRLLQSGQMREVGKYRILGQIGKGGAAIVFKKGKVTEDIEFYSVMRTIRTLEEADVIILMLDATEGIGPVGQRDPPVRHRTR